MMSGCHRFLHHNLMDQFCGACCLELHLCVLLELDFLMQYVNDLLRLILLSPFRPALNSGLLLSQRSIPMMHNLYSTAHLNVTSCCVLTSSMKRPAGRFQVLSAQSSSRLCAHRGSGTLIPHSFPSLTILPTPKSPNKVLRLPFAFLTQMSDLQDYPGRECVSLFLQRPRSCAESYRPSSSVRRPARETLLSNDYRS
jgi:hypothetical protein